MSNGITDPELQPIMNTELSLTYKQQIAMKSHIYSSNVSHVDREFALWWREHVLLGVSFRFARISWTNNGSYHDTTHCKH